MCEQEREDMVLVIAKKRRIPVLRLDLPFLDSTNELLICTQQAL